LRKTSFGEGQGGKRQRVVVPREKRKEGAGTIALISYGGGGGGDRTSTHFKQKGEEGAFLTKKGVFRPPRTGPVGGKRPLIKSERGRKGHWGKKGGIT